MEDVVYRFVIPVLSTGSSSVRGQLNLRVNVNPGMRSNSKQGIVRFEMYMYDRDLIQSNIVVTPDISIR
jgi:hypothetical protein